SIVLWQSGGVDATGVTFYTSGGSQLDRAVLANNYTIATQVGDIVDAAGLGLARFTAGKIYVSAASAAGAFERAIGASSTSDVIYVQDGAATVLTAVITKTITFSGNFNITSSNIPTDSTATAVLSSFTSRKGSSVLSVNVTGMNANQVAAVAANQSSFTNVSGGTYYYPDADNDTYGSAIATPVYAPTALLSGLANATTNHTDCNDALASAHVVIDYYADADGDSIGVNPGVGFCLGSAPSGYVGGLASANQDNCPSNANPGQENCDGNSIGDACQFANVGDTVSVNGTVTVASGNMGVVYSGTNAIGSLSGVTNSTSPTVIFTLQVNGDLDAADETISLSLNGIGYGTFFATGGSACGSVSSISFSMNSSEWNKLLSISGSTVAVSLSASSAVENCSPIGTSSLTVSYGGAAYDCDSDGQSDYCQTFTGNPPVPNTLVDCNGNHLLDTCEAWAGADCDGDLVINDCETDDDNDTVADVSDAFPCDAAKTAADNTMTDAALGTFLAAAPAGTATVNASGMTSSAKGIVSTNISHVASITNLALVSGDAAAAITNLLSKTSGATANAASMAAAQLTALSGTIANVASITSLSLTSAESASEITNLLSKTTGATAIATSMIPAQLSALGGSASKIAASGITGTLAVNVDVTSLDALLGKAADATTNVNAASFDAAGKDALSNNITKMIAITNLALASTESSGQITSLLMFATNATANAASMDAAQLTALSVNIYNVASISNLSLTSAQTAGVITNLLGKATASDALVDATGMSLGNSGQLSA
ncbi:MAG: hypothetical protein EBY29_12420, partial [Planctomycetes bacterium]|nr:hypothetical protein [Planctomycetota bacterium]